MVDGEPRRPSKIRRLIVAIARAIALFILIAGLYMAMTIALPQMAVVNRGGIALIVGVVVFEMLRRPARIVYLPSESAPVLDNSEELAEAQHALDQLRGEVEAAHARETKARQEFEHEHDQLQRAATRALEEIQRLRTANDELRGQIETRKHDAETRAAASRELEALKADRSRARREVEEAKQKAEVEKAAQRKTIESDWSSKLKDMQRELELTRSTAQKLLQSNEALKQQLEEERQRLHGEVQRIVAESKSERDEMQAEARAVAARLEELLAQLDRERKLSQELSTTRARLDEENATLRKARDTAMQRALQLERQLAENTVSHNATKGEVESLKQQMEQSKVEARSARQQLDSEWSAKLQKIVTGLTTDHENDMGDAIAAREAARAEVRSLTLRISRLESDNEQLKEQLEERAVPAVDEKALREQIDAEWNAKLQTIVSHIASDHEADIGKAIEEREAARAEARSLTMRVAKLEQQLTERAAPPIDEKALREKIDAEWSEKLQTIVSHIATDHEADIGKAIEEREAARAEVRNLNIKMTALQQKLDGERQARESLQSRLREAEDQIRNAPTQPMQAFREPEPPAQEVEKARADVLQFAEQAFEAIRKASSPGDVPLPAIEEKKPRILIVHHDPALRSMWRENLGKSGFDVQTAADGLEGLRVVKSEKPEVVIADVSMPKMDGRELCHLIKSNEETADVKVILLTGVYTNEVPLDAATKQYAADELLRKPVKLEAMKAALQNLLPAAKIAS